MFKHPHPCPSLRSRVRSWRPSRLTGCVSQRMLSTPCRHWVYYGGSQFWRLSAAGSWCNASRVNKCVSSFRRKSGNVITIIRSTALNSQRFLSIIYKEEDAEASHEFAWPQTPELANSLGLFISQHGAEFFGRSSSPYSSDPHIKIGPKLFED